MTILLSPPSRFDCLTKITSLMNPWALWTYHWGRMISQATVSVPNDLQLVVIIRIFNAANKQPIRDLFEFTLAT